MSASAGAEDPVGVAADADHGAGLVGRNDRFRHDGLDLAGAHAVGRGATLLVGLADYESADQHAGVDREHGEDRRHGGRHRLDRSRGGRRAGCHQGDQRTAGNGEGAREATRDNLASKAWMATKAKGQSHRQADERGARQNGR